MRIIITAVLLVNLHFGLLAQNEPTLDVTPNPFKDTTSIIFTLLESDTVSLVVYDQWGVLVDSLIKEQLMTLGTQSIQFIGDTLPNGQYFAFLDVDTHMVSKKLIKVQCAVSIITTSNPMWCSPCDGLANAVASGTAPFSYAWSSGDTTSSVDSICAGLHIVTVTDSVGCTATDSITLIQEPDMTVSITTTSASCLTCSDGCITIIPSDGCGAPYTINTIPVDPFFMPCQVSPGTYVIEVCDACGCCTQDTVAVDTLLVGMTEITLQDLIIYPNPTTGKITLTNLPQKVTVITIYTAIGELLYTTRLANNQIDITNLPEGVYLLHLQLGETVLRKKIVKT